MFYDIYLLNLDGGDIKKKVYKLMKEMNETNNIKFKEKVYKLINK